MTQIMAALNRDHHPRNLTLILLQDPLIITSRNLKGVSTLSRDRSLIKDLERSTLHLHTLIAVTIIQILQISRFKRKILEW
jgi:hypothetical protein